MSGSERKTPNITLQPFTQVRLHLTGDDGKPLAGMKILPRYLYHDRDAALWFAGISDVWTGVTDANGDATLAKLPQGYTVALGVEDENYTEPNQRDPLVLARTADTPNQTIRLFRAGTIAGTVHYGTPTGTPAAGVQVQAQGSQGGGGGARTDKDGHFLIKCLRPGHYALQPYVLGADGPQWTALAQPAVLASGGSLSGVILSLIHGALLNGTVTDKATGKPVAGTTVLADGPGETHAYAQTGADGHYQFRVPPGSQSVIAYGRGPQPAVQQAVQIADGQTKTVDFQVVPPPVPFVVKGVVVGPDGRPVPGAHIQAAGDFSGSPDAVADVQGLFVYDDPGLTAAARLFARSGSLATQAAATPGGDVTLHLLPGVLCTVRGVVRDNHGQPLPNVKVTLTLWLGNIGRQADTVQTDAEGRYTFAPTFGNVKYDVRAERAGYAPAEAPQTAVLPGKTLTLRPLTLIRADSFVGGIVLDPRGKPEAGAQVTVMHGGYASGTTNAQGRFRITGVPPGRAMIEAKAPDGRTAYASADVGTDANTVKVTTQAELEAESRRFGAMMQGDPTNHGNGADANALLAGSEKRAGATGRQVFLIFHASWCGPCFLLHRTLGDPKVKPGFEAHFVVQDIDIWEQGDKHKTWENPGGVALYKKYGGIKPGGGRQGVPFIVVLDPHGRKRGDSTRSGQNIGVPTASEEIKTFFRMLKRASPGLPDAEAAVFAEVIRRYEF